MAFPDIVSAKMAKDNPDGKAAKSATEPSTITENLPFPPAPKPPEGDQPVSPPASPAESEPAPVPAPEPASGRSVEVELGGKKEDVVEKKTIDLAGGNFFDKDIDKKTSTASQKDKHKEQKSAEARSITEEPVEDKALVPEKDDYEFVGGLMVEGLDLATSTVFRWWAMDTTDVPYEMTKKKKDKLSAIVGEGLRRMNKKFPLIVLFLITLALALYTPGRKAYDMRQVKIAEKAAEKKSTPPKGGGKPPPKGGQKKTKASRPAGGVNK